MSEDWIENKINRGAFSKVYKATLRSTKNIYVLKIIENNEHINRELVNE
ncbi:8233_t:CDS:2, partial [Cetraspora pellucida]